mmetsp:Transcript_5059/g.2830  ORF Transcript_5059/g.2830 Transcript_5059/m.2830 type:complete len:147 (+) Transcript_5059:1212-1652(+)
MVKIPTNILLVDDEKDFIDMLALRLEENGERVAVAYSGKECLEIIKEKDIDVVILDIKMSGIDGMETLKEIKRINPIIEVIMLTGHGSIETSVKGVKAGAFDYLLKPTDFEDLLEKLEGARKRNEEQKERIRKAEEKILLRKSGII